MFSLRQIDTKLGEMAQSVCANRLMTFHHITLPRLTPHRVSGFAVRGNIVVLAELFAKNISGAPTGYGLCIAWESNRTNEVFAWTVWLLIPMMLTDWLTIAVIEKYAARWNAR